MNFTVKYTEPQTVTIQDMTPGSVGLYENDTLILRTSQGAVAIGPKGDWYNHYVRYHAEASGLLPLWNVTLLPPGTEITITV